MGDLSSYLKRHGITQEEFARRADMSQGMVSKLCAGTVGISLANAAKIQRLTDGEVSISTWLPEPEAGAA